MNPETVLKAIGLAYYSSENSGQLRCNSSCAGCVKFSKYQLYYTCNPQYPELTTILNNNKGLFIPIADTYFAGIIDVGGKEYIIIIGGKDKIVDQVYARHRVIAQVLRDICRNSDLEYCINYLYNNAYKIHNMVVVVWT